MSVIFGVAWVDGRPIGPDVARRLTAAAAAAHQTSLTTVVDAHAVLGRALIPGTVEDAHDRLPIADTARRVTVTAAGRLDNRDELCDRWAIAPARRASTADAALMAAAYLEWGDEAPKRLCGDWALAAWHHDERRLFLARDHTGMTSLFFACIPPFVAFASRVDVLLTLPEVSLRIDEEWTTRALLVRPGALEGTLYHDVRQVPPAHQLSVTADGARLTPYWSAASIERRSTGTATEDVEGFVEVYRRAARARLRSIGHVATTLSAGLDSGSVTALAAEGLREAGRTLIAFTAVPRFPLGDRAASWGDEGALAGETARRWNAAHHLVDAAALSPVAAIRRTLDDSRLPVHGAANLYWLLSIARRAHEADATVLLIGQAGNLTVSWRGQPGGYLRLIRRARLAGVWPALAARAARAFRRRSDDWRRWAAPNPALVARLHREGRLAPPPAIPVTSWQGAVERRARGLQYALLSTGAFYPVVGDRFGLVIRDPTADIRLVEYCLSLPVERYVSSDSDRALIRLGMREHLPPSVVQQHSRFRQAADLCERLVADSAGVEEALDELAASSRARDYVDIDALQAAWHRVRAGHPDRLMAASSTLARGIMVGLAVAAAHRARP